MSIISRCTHLPLAGVSQQLQKKARTGSLFSSVFLPTMGQPLALARSLNSVSQIAHQQIAAPKIAAKHTPASILVDEINKVVNAQFPEHPFATLLSKNNSKSVLARYYAMSQAFPFLQAGAYRNVIMRAIQDNSPITQDVEKTFVVGSFLCWDETGGHFLIKEKGMVALPDILNTSQFHANMLKADLKTIFGMDFNPEYCPVTKVYLIELEKRLGSENRVERCAMMVAFETHAHKMIESLWHSIASTYDIEKEQLAYFEAHVGGSDPAEAYHVAMTQKLVNCLIAPEEKEVFEKHFIDCYKLNIDWCRHICN